jgi:hypothetical protein
VCGKSGVEHHKCCLSRFDFCRSARRLANAAAAALLVQWYQGGAPSTVALFGSGVPILTLATYLFTVIGAVDYPNPAGENLCSQLWSEWLLATGSLFIGSAVLVCGCGLRVVSAPGSKFASELGPGDAYAAQMTGNRPESTGCDRK